MGPVGLDVGWLEGKGVGTLVGRGEGGVVIRLPLNEKENPVDVTEESLWNVTLKPFELTITTSAGIEPLQLWLPPLPPMVKGSQHDSVLNVVKWIVYATEPPNGAFMVQLKSSLLA